MNFCRDSTVGSGAGESRKLLRIDSSEGAMIDSSLALFSEAMEMVIEHA